jgi:MinD superfamily P-loop ATPase
VTEREPLWTSEDRAYLLAYIGERDEVCGGCGNPLDECRDPATARQWRIVEEQCEACRIGEAHADNLAEASAQSKAAKQRGVFHGVVRAR